MNAIKNIYRKYLKNQPLRTSILALSVCAILITSFGKWQELTLWEYLYALGYCFTFSSLVLLDLHETIYLNLEDRSELISTLREYDYKTVKEKKDKILLMTNQGDWFRGYKMITIKEKATCLEVLLPKSISREMIKEYKRIF